MSEKFKYLLVQYVTVARIPLAILVAVLLYFNFAQPKTVLATVIVGILILQELTDIFDGLLARRLNASSRFGALFDPYCDSVSRLITFFGLASAGLCPFWLFLLMALRDVSVSYIRIICIQRNKPVQARLSGKAKAWAQGLGAILLAALFAWFGDKDSTWQKVIYSLIAIITLWSLLDYFDAARQKQPPADESPAPPEDN